MRIKFIRNKCYQGRDYGPDYPEQIADVDEKWARAFLASGSAVVAEGESAPLPRSGLTVTDLAANADPQPITRAAAPAPARKAGK